MLSQNKKPTLLLKNLRRLVKRKHPGILIFGDKSVGKQTFLKNAGLHQIVEIPSDASEIQVLNSDVGVFIIIEEISHLEHYWTSIEKYLSRILWIIDAPHLLAQQSFQKLTKFFSTINHSILISIALNSTDRLAGFFDFFSHLRPNEIEGACGFSFSKNKHPLQKFLQHFYQPIIKKLHDERSPEKRRLIREFPIQIERSTKHLLEEIQILRRNKQVDFIFYMSNNPPNDSTFPQRPYFIKNIVPMILTKKKTNIVPKINTWRWLALPLTPAILSVAVFLIHQAFRINDVALAESQKIIETPIQGNNFVTTLNKLYWIHQTLLDTQKWPSLFGFDQTLKIEKQSGLRYETFLQTQFKTLIMETLKKTITENLNKNRLDLYNALASYLMLTTENRFDSKAIMQWFTLLWRKEYATDNKMQIQLQTHLQNLLAQIQSPYHQDKGLVLEARSFLSTMSPPELAFLRLQNQYSKEDVSPLGEKQTMPGVNLNNATIPLFYDTDNFQKIYHTDIPKLVDDINEENWVLGITNKIELSEAQKAGLVEEVQKMYLDNFSLQWADVLTHIQMSEASTLSDTLRGLNLLTDEKSPFLQLIKAIVTNVNLSNNPNLAKIKPLTEALSQFTAQDKNLQNLIANLNALQKALTAISTNKDQNQASFQLASAYFSNPLENNLAGISKDASTLPEPLKSWLNSLTKSSLNIILTNSKVFLNAQWQKTVTPFYQSKLNNQFPLFPGASTDISFADFKSFFGPKGLIDNFFTKYLQAFVDTQSQYWVFKKINGQAFPIDQKKLNMFIRASLIQEMFFTDNPDKIAFHFYLTPISINPTLRSFSLNVDNQQYVFTRKSHTIVKYFWPISKTSMASITFTPKRLPDAEVAPTPFMLTQSGPWAWFRLLNTSGKIVPGPNAQVFTLSFTNDGKRVRFKLVSDNLMNPYLPNIITKFRCPDNL